MNRERTTTIIANLLLEIQASGNLSSKDSDEIIMLLQKRWKQNDY